MDVELEALVMLREIETRVEEKVMSEQKGEAFKPEVVMVDGSMAEIERRELREGLPIGKIIGHKPNDDAGPMEKGYGAQWTFTVDGGPLCRIYFRGSTPRAYGPLESFQKLFGKENVK